MRDDESGTAQQKTLEGLQDRCLCPDIHSTGWFIENQDGRIFQESASKGNALTLASREPHTSLSNRRLIAFGEFRDKLVGIGGSSCRVNLLNAGSRARVRYVFRYTARKEHWFLLHKSELIA
jgi:hypothetical protein